MKVGAQPAAISVILTGRGVGSRSRAFYLPALSDCPIV
jgi:hypothetical protein